MKNTNTTQTIIIVFKGNAFIWEMKTHHSNNFSIIPALLLFSSFHYYACAAAATADSTERMQNIVNMQKSIYSVLGQYDVPTIVSRFSPAFKALDTDGTLIQTLDTLYEMRLMDMQISIDHAQKMRIVLEGLLRQQQQGEEEKQQERKNMRIATKLHVIQKRKRPTTTTQGGKGKSPAVRR